MGGGKKELAVIRWDSAVEKILKDKGAYQEEVMSAGTFGGTRQK